jgi:polyisoprenoid-binding protein YceI
LFDCTVELGADTLQARISVKAPVAAFNTGNSNRDSHTLELLDAFKFPFVEFVSDSIRRDSGDYRVFGHLQFHGVKKPVSFPVEWWNKDGKTHVTAEFKVKLSDHKIKRPTLMMVPTEDVLRIKVLAVAKNP